MQVNQLNDANGKHSGVKAHGGNADVRYASKNGNKIERVETGSANFDKKNSQKLADIAKKFGFKDPNTGIFTENPKSNGPALRNTHFPSNTFNKKTGVRRFTHQNHMHLNSLDPKKFK